MKKKVSGWLGILVFLPLLLCLILVNIFFDPANLFHNVSQDIADSLMAGNPTYITSGNMNERRVKHRMIETMEDEVDCIALGASIMMGIRGEHVGAESYYNLGLSGADFYDIMAQFGMLDFYEKKVNRVVFCVDTNFFCKSIYDNSARNVSYRPYARYMLDVLNGGTPEEPKSDDTAENMEALKQMFSISYFQSCVNYIRANKILNISRWGVADEEYTGTYYLPDGSMVYAMDYQRQTALDVQRTAAEYHLPSYFVPYESISPESTEAFEKLIVYLQEQGTEVELLLCPLAPSLWDRCDEEVNGILWETEQFALEMGEKYGLQVTGSYNPYQLGITDEEFYDCRHMRHEALEKYFEF